MPPTLKLLFAALVIALAGCGTRRAEQASPPQRAAAQAPPVVPVTVQEIRALTHRPGSRGTLVNVWATWCAPCREEFPALLRVSRAHERDGLRLVLISADFDDQLPAVRSFLAAQGVSDTTYLKSSDDMPFINTLDPRWTGALPATFVYDGAGVLTAFWEGRADEARFTAAIDAALTHDPRSENRRP